MSTVLSKWMTLFLSLTIMFTPMLVYVDSLHREVVDTVLHQGLKEASIKGYFTTDIINDIKDTLVNDYNFQASTIEITATQTVKQRGDYIEISLSVPRGPIFLLDIFNQGSDKITRNAKIMSEYIN
jgi:hypothetical protein